MAWHKYSSRWDPIQSQTMAKILGALLMLLLVGGVPTFAIEMDMFHFHHVDLGHLKPNLTFSERVQVLAKHGEARFNFFANKVNKRSHAFGMELLDGFGSPVQYLEASGLHVIPMAIGAPSRLFNLMLDVLLRLTVLQCQPEPSAVLEHNIYYPGNSTSVGTVRCQKKDTCQNFVYNQKYCVRNREPGKCTYSDYHQVRPNLPDLPSLKDRPSLKGFLLKDTFLFPGIWKDVIFGCDEKRWGINHMSGILGLGRGSLGILEQMGFSNFSYCLQHINVAHQQPSRFCLDCHLPPQNEKTPVLIRLVGHKAVSPFRFFRNMNVRAVRVNDKVVKVGKAFTVSPNGNGGLFIDSGITFSYLTDAAFDPLANAVRNESGVAPLDFKVDGFDLCFKQDEHFNLESLPKINFEIFSWTEALSPSATQKIFLPNTNAYVQNIGDTHDITCLAFKRTTEKLSFWGIFQQQGFQIFFETENLMTMIPDQC